MITIKQKGNFSKTTNFLKKNMRSINISMLHKYGQQGVEALSSSTPFDSGETSKSWYYKIRNINGRIAITFYNSNIQNGVPIAIILQYGHGTRNGGWVEGKDYINPAIHPIFDKISNDAWLEVINS